MLARILRSRRSPEHGASGWSVSPSFQKTGARMEFDELFRQSELQRPSYLTGKRGADMVPS